MYPTIPVETVERAAWLAPHTDAPVDRTIQAASVKPTVSDYIQERSCTPLFAAVMEISGFK